MRLLSKLPLLRGRATVFERSFVKGKIIDRILLQKNNTILYSAADLSAKALAGAFRVNGMYFAFANDPPPISADTPDKTRTATWYQTTGSSGTKGFCRVATIAEPSYAASSALYVNNKVTFVAISSSTVAVPSGSNEVTDGTSQFYDCALGYLHPTDMEQDVLLAAVAFKDLSGGITEIAKIAGAQIGIRWDIYLEV
jgi:hypothetical protein